MEQRQASSSSQPILVDTNYGRLPLSELRDDGVCVVQLPFSHSAQLFVNANQVADNNQRKQRRDDAEDEQKEDYVPVKRQNSLPRAPTAESAFTNPAAAPFTPASSMVGFGTDSANLFVTASNTTIHNPFQQPAESPFTTQTQPMPTSFPQFGSQSAAANGTTTAQNTAFTAAASGSTPLFQPRGSSIPPHHTSSIEPIAADSPSADDMMQ